MDFRRREKCHEVIRKDTHYQAYAGSLLLPVFLLCAGVFSAEPSDALETLKVVRGSVIWKEKSEPGDYITVRNFLSEPANFKNDWQQFRHHKEKRF
jgi:hypothetical protein